jgi:hypothetical protein
MQMQRVLIVGGACAALLAGGCANQFNGPPSSDVPKAVATTASPSAPPLSPLAILGKITGG